LPKKKKKGSNSNQSKKYFLKSKFAPDAEKKNKTISGFVGPKTFFAGL